MHEYAATAACPGECQTWQALDHAQASKGLFNLCNQGLLPAYLDLTPALQGGDGPVRSGRAAMHPYEEQVRTIKAHCSARCELIAGRVGS